MMRIRAILACALALIYSESVSGAVVDVTVTFENLAPTNSVAFAPIHVGFGNGTFNAFDINTAATGGIVPLAETGSGAQWFNEFAAAEPNATTGSLLPPPILPGGTVTRTFRVDTDVNRFFTFAGMVLPSNDLFIGNDNAIQLLDANGNLLLNQINQTAAAIWDANSEVAIPANAAFIAGADPSQRVEENGVVAFDFSELTTYNGLTTGAGYVFDSSQIASGTNIGQFTFSATAVPEPSSMGLLGMAGVGFALRRRKQR